LLTTAVNLGENPNAQGSGRADVFGAYQKITTQPLPDLPDPPEPGQPGDSQPTGCLQQVKRLLLGG
jgi:hypothetical protein